MFRIKPKPPKSSGCDLSTRNVGELLRNKSPGRRMFLNSEANVKREVCHANCAWDDELVLDLDLLAARHLLASWPSGLLLTRRTLFRCIIPLHPSQLVHSEANERPSSITVVILAFQGTIREWPDGVVHLTASKRVSPDWTWPCRIARSHHKRCQRFILVCAAHWATVRSAGTHLRECALQAAFQTDRTNQQESAAQLPEARSVFWPKEGAAKQITASTARSSPLSQMNAPGGAS